MRFLRRWRHRNALINNVYLRQLLPFLLPFALLMTTNSLAQRRLEIYTVDLVKVKDEKVNEACYFYENNWKIYRDTAIKRGFIKSYTILKTKADSAGELNLLLVTEFADSLQYQLSEKRFQELIQSIRPNGPMLLNHLRPDDFRKILFMKQFSTL